MKSRKTPEDKEANEWALDYWEKRSLETRTDEIFIKKYGYDPNPSCNEPDSLQDFVSWPGGGGNLNYPMVYKEGLASVIKDVEETAGGSRYAACTNAPKFYFYEACLDRS